MAGIFLRNPDGTSRPQARPYDFIRSMTASASKVDLKNKNDVEQIKKRRSLATWQTEAWEYSDQIGEVKYAFNLVGNVTSRCRIFPALVNDMQTAPSAITEDDPDLPEGMYDAAIRALQRLESTTGGQASLLREAAINLGITGEAYLVQTPEKMQPELGESWDIKSVDEVTVSPNGKVQLVSSPAGSGAEKPVELPDNAFVGRVWRPSPRFSSEADSSVKGLLDLMDELLLLNHTFRATARSRLNAGLLYIPDSITSSASIDSAPIYDVDTDATTGDAEEDQDDIETNLIESMVTPITDESSAAAVVPLILRGPADAAEALKLIKFERAFDQNLALRADKVLERILLGLDIPKDIISGLANTKFCVDEETEALTRDGWKRYDQIQAGDEVYSIDLDTELGVWTPVSAMNVFDVQDELMLRLEKRGHSSLSTMNHRWFVRRQTAKNGEIIYDRQVVRSDELATNHFVPIAAPAADLPAEPKYTDAFVELVAWYWTEGFVREAKSWTHAECKDRAGFKAWVTEKRNALGMTTVELGHRLGTYKTDNSANTSYAHFMKAGGVRSSAREKLAAALSVDQSEVDQFFGEHAGRDWVVLTQSEEVHPEFTQRIRQCLTALCGPARVMGQSLREPAWNEWVISTGVVQFGLNHEAAAPLLAVCEGKDKITRLDFIQSLTQAQLELFIQTAIDADGHERNGDQHITQKVSERLDAMELACILSGKAVHRYVATNSSPYTDPYVLKIKKRTWMRPFRSVDQQTESTVTYTGKVWCPTTGTGTFIARRHGTVYLTMNSNASIINEHLYRAHIEPLVVLICDALTYIYLRPSLRAAGFDEEAIKKVVIWYDPSEIVTRPDRADDANQGHDRYTISDATWRASHGFSEEDAPDAAEIVKRMGIEKGQILPELAEAILAWYAPQAMNEIRGSAEATGENQLPPEISEALLPETGEPATTPNGTVEPTTPIEPEQFIPPTEGVPQ